MSYKNRLQAMKSNWQKGKEASAEPFTTVPPGNYRAQLELAELMESSSSGKMMIKRMHSILEGEFEGKKVYDYLHLETDRGPEFIARWIDQMGYEAPDEPTELEEILEAIVKDAAICKIRVVVSGDFTNVRILAVEESGADAPAPAPAAAPKSASTRATKPKAEAPAPAPAPAPAEDPDDDNFDEAVAFLQARDVELDEEEGESMESLIEKIQENGPYKADELTEEETTLLGKLELAGCIQTKKAAAKKTVAKKKVARKKK